MEGWDWVEVEGWGWVEVEGWDRFEVEGWDWVEVEGWDWVEGDVRRPTVVQPEDPSGSDASAQDFGRFSGRRGPGEAAGAATAEGFALEVGGIGG